MPPVSTSYGGSDTDAYRNGWPVEIPADWQVIAEAD
jgi:hypothetical protein